MNKTFLQMQEIINLSEVNQWLLSFYPTVKMSYPYNDFVMMGGMFAGHDQSGK